ncbi:hypothetical protein V6Z11_A05G209000 [Gossypium hirsutum]
MSRDIRMKGTNIRNPRIFLAMDCCAITNRPYEILTKKGPHLKKGTPKIRTITSVNDVRKLILSSIFRMKNTNLKSILPRHKIKPNFYKERVILIMKMLKPKSSTRSRLTNGLSSNLSTFRVSSRTYPNELSSNLFNLITHPFQN